MEPKLAKQQQNLDLQKQETQSMTESYERIKQLYEKSEEMKQVSQANSEQIDDQFKTLRDRLSKTSGFLNKMKKHVENIKLSYQKNINELCQYAEGKGDELNDQMEEIKKSIEKIRERVARQKDPTTYENALETVIKDFEEISSLQKSQ